MPYKIILAFLTLLPMVAVCQHPILSGTVDAKSNTTIIYPPITEREGKGLQIPVPPTEHPRLYFTQKNIVHLKEKITNPLFNDCWEKITQAAKMETDGMLKPDTTKSNLDISVRNAIEAKALLSVFNNDKTLARQAVDAMLNFYATINIDKSKADVTRDIGRCIVTGAMVYDWCYNLITPKERATLISSMEALATYMEIQWPKLVEGSVVGHGTEAELSRDILSMGVATYNEKPIIYNLAAGRIFAEFLPVRHVFYPAFYHHQGSAYGPYRYGWDLNATLIFDRMGYPNLFGKDQGKPPYYWLYLRRPDGQLMRNGDDFNELFIPFNTYWANMANADAFAGSYFKDPILVNQALKERKIGSTGDYFFDFLLFDADFPLDKNKTSLPLTKYFQQPLGAMVARTSWEDGMQTNTVVAEMKIGVRSFVNHEHLDAGSFQIYYKGPLALQSGIYQGLLGAYGDSHFVNYSQRTIAHNTMLFYDPNEKFYFRNKEISNDGGQHYPNNAAEPKNLEELLKDEYKVGEVLAHAIGPDSLKPAFSYLKGQLAPAYSKKVKSFQRSFVFLNLMDAEVPAALIVFDNVVTANKDIKKYWLMHSVQEPSIDGFTTTIERTEKGYSGKMLNTTLLPRKENLVINKIGGLGNEFTVSGKNYPQIPFNQGNNSYDSAVWRIEVSPKNAAASDLFLNVMQVMDTQENKPLNVEKIETEKLVGCKLGNRLVMFSKSGETINDDFKLTVTGKETYQVMIADLAEGNWKIQNIASGKGSTVVVKKEEHNMFFTAASGNYLISKVVKNNH